MMVEGPFCAPKERRKIFLLGLSAEKSDFLRSLSHGYYYWGLIEPPSGFSRLNPERSCIEPTFRISESVSSRLKAQARAIEPNGAFLFAASRTMLAIMIVRRHHTGHTACALLCAVFLSILATIMAGCVDKLEQTGGSRIWGRICTVSNLSQSDTSECGVALPPSTY